MAKILVTGYSRTGFTKTVAEQIARACNAELEFIQDGVNRSGAAGYVRSAVEAGLGIDLSLHTPKHEPDSYDIVVIGTPVWLWNVASPVRAYIKRYQRQFRRVALFCTYGGSGHVKVLHDLQDLIGRPAVSTLAITDDEIANRLYFDRLSKFVATIKSAGNIHQATRRNRKTQ